MHRRVKQASVETICAAAQLTEASAGRVPQ